MGGALEYQEIVDATRHSLRHSRIPNFVETGTYRGDTALMAAKHYRAVYTTEIAPGLYELSSKRAKEEGLTNIHFYLGDSSEVLRDICPRVIEGAVFFIDAHQSGSDTANNGKSLVPLFDELEVILSHKLGPSMFIFDDVRFWKGESQEVPDWAHVSRLGIINRFLERGYRIQAFFIKNDRFFVLTV